MWGYFRANSFFSTVKRVSPVVFFVIYQIQLPLGEVTTPISPFPTPLDTFGVSQQWVLLVFIVEQNSVGISAVMLVVFYRCLGIHTLCATEPLYENMTSSTKPEIHNVPQRPERRTEPEPLASCKKHRWSSAMWFSSYASGHTDERTTKQTYSSQYFALLRFYGAPCISYTRTATTKVYGKGGYLN